MADPVRRRRQLAAFLGALLLLNPPALAVVDALVLPGRVPLTPAYLLVAWIGVIALAGWLASRQRS
jgi:hypothetical protein